MAANIFDKDFLEYADKVKGQTVLVTGAASGIGKASALAFARAGANIVFCDLNEAGARATLIEIEALGMKAAFQLCDIVKWEEQVSLFEFAFSKFGSIDVVIANAGVTEFGHIGKVNVGSDGLPMKPITKTMDVNLIGNLYTTYLASHYLTKATNSKSLRSIVLIGSILSLTTSIIGTQYGGSKHGLLSYMKSIQRNLRQKGVRIALIAPFYVETGITKELQLLLSGTRLLPISRVANVTVLAATDETPDSHGSVYVLPDDTHSLRLAPGLLDRDGLINLCTMIEAHMAQIN